MSRRIRGHLRSNVIGYCALFFAITGTALASHPGGTNTIDSGDIINAEVRSADIAGLGVNTEDLGNGAVTIGKLGSNSVNSLKTVNNSLTAADLAANSVRNSELAGNAADSSNVVDESLTGADLGIDSVGSSEIATDSVGSSEIQSGVVGADELDTVHEHFGPATNVTDGTAHDGAYGPSTQSVSCGTGEDLLSVSVDWTSLGGHNEVFTSGVDSITRSEPDSAIVRVGFDGGAGPATYQPVATCIF